MTHAEVAAMLSAVMVPVAYHAFPETGQQPPFICYYYTGDNDFVADDVNYQRIDHLIVELYTDEKDFALEKAVESALNGHGLVYTRQETYLDDERMHETIYETDVIITEVTNG